MSNLKVANTILDQMGGTRRLTTMIGGRGYAGNKNSVTFRYMQGAKNKANCVRVTLEDSDTYMVEFLAVRGTDVKEISKFEGIFSDGLVALFERETALALTLGRVDGN